MDGRFYTTTTIHRCKSIMDPTKKGNYKIVTFVWDSIADPIPLAKNQMFKFTIS